MNIMLLQARLGLLQEFLLLGHYLGVFYWACMDSIGRKRTLFIGLIFFILTTSLYFIHLGITFLLITRLLHGITLGYREHSSRNDCGSDYPEKTKRRRYRLLQYEFDIVYSNRTVHWTIYEPTYKHLN